MKTRIVAEITKNWWLHSDGDRTPYNAGPLIAQMFEDVIAKNEERGYILEDWRFSQVITEDVLTETIIAVFTLGVRRS